MDDSKDANAANDSDQPSAEQPLVTDSVETDREHNPAAETSRDETQNTATDGREALAA